jgi:medium-chain acyl-[acyl-carrier-protein] hydrolase
LQAAQPALFVPSDWKTGQGIVLFCFPYAGGSPYLFLSWRTGLQPGIQIAAFQAPGRGARFAERPQQTIAEVVAEIMDGFPDMEGRPFAFYGHSMGAIIAFELALRLRKDGKPQPCHLMVGAARPPQLGPMRPVLHALPEEEFLNRLQSRYGSIPKEILNDPDALALFLPALRADFAAYENYEYQPDGPLQCPITAFFGAEDHLVPREAWSDWSVHTCASFYLESVPGNHFFLEKSRDHLLCSIRQKLQAGR